MDLGLKGKIAIVGGSSKGLGRACAFELAREGSNVVLCSRHEEQLLVTAREIGSQTGSQVLALPADLSRSGDIESLVNTTVDRFGRVDILVNNTGGPPAGTFETLSEEDWLKAIEQNLLSAVRLCRAVVPCMKRQGWGRIINITSLAAKEPMENLILSNSARAGVIGLAKSMSNELARYNITVNSVLPGFHLTDRVAETNQFKARQEGRTPDEVLADRVKTIPAGRMGRPEELAAAVAFLASERASYINGVALVIDGGFSQSAL